MIALKEIKLLIKPNLIYIINYYFKKKEMK